VYLVSEMISIANHEKFFYHLADSFLTALVMLFSYRNFFVFLNNFIVHASGFIGGNMTKEGALSMASKALSLE
jgi:hypothetical protein